MDLSRIARRIAQAVTLGEIMKELLGASPRVLSLVDRLRATSAATFVPYAPFVKRKLSLKQKARRAIAEALLGLCEDPTWYFFVKLVVEQEQRVDIAPVVKMLTLAKRRRSPASS